MSDAFIGVRRDYHEARLDENMLAADPIEQLRQWLDDAAKAGVIEPNGMCVSSVSADERPSSRIVLLRGLDARGLTFYTNYQSRKGQEIKENVWVSANFWWGALERQVRVEGKATRLSGEESDRYFASRPYGSQIATAASPQSQVISNRDELEQMVEGLKRLHPEHIDRPPQWGGYVIEPDRFEFWQGRPARLHDRLVYRKVGAKWVIERLAS